MSIYRIAKKIAQVATGLFGFWMIYKAPDQNEAFFQFIAWGFVMVMISVLFGFGRMIASHSYIGEDDKGWRPKVDVDQKALERMRKTRAIIKIILVMIVFLVCGLIVLSLDLIFHGELTLPMSLFG